MSRPLHWRQVEARDEAGRNGISCGREDDRNGLGGRERSPHGDDATAGDDDRDVAADKLGGQRR